MVEAADAPDFIKNVRKIFNNDSDNSSGQGVGKDREYFETYEGKLINAKGLKARYIRFYSNGSSDSALNEYTEIEVYGRPAKGQPRLPASTFCLRLLERRTKLPPCAASVRTPSSR